MFEGFQSISVGRPLRQRQHSLNLSLSQQSLTNSLGGFKIKSYQTPINKSSVSISNIRPKQLNRSCSNSRCSVSPTNSNFKPIKTSQKYMKSLLEKSFNKSLSLMNAGEILTQHNMIDLFSYLGLFRDPPTPLDMFSAKNVIKVLDRQDRGIKRQNLLKLIYLISNIPLLNEKTDTTDNPSSGLRRDTEQQLNSEKDIEIGRFNDHGVWITNEEDQKRVRDIFGSLYYNKISNENVKYISNPSIEKPTFKPQILSVSSTLGSKHRRRLVSNADQRSTQDLLIIQGQLTRSKVEENKKFLQNKQLDSCTFKPKINPKYKGSNRHHVVHEKNDSTNHQRFMTSSQIQEQKQFRECSFKPKTIALKQNHQPPIVKNELKMVNRLKEAYNKRVISNTIKERGYPKEVNWTQYLHHSKNMKKEKKPVISIDIKISGEIELLHIYHGQSLQNIVCKILVKNKLPYDYQQNVESLLKQAIEQSSNVHIHDGFIYSK